MTALATGRFGSVMSITCTPVDVVTKA